MPSKRIPRLFVRHGHLVWPTGPKAWDTLVRDRTKIVMTARKLYKDHDDQLYLVDADGLRHGEANLELYQRLERAGVHPWLEAGFRRIEDVMDGFFAGAAQLTVHLKDMHPDEFKEVTDATQEPVHLAVTAGRDEPVKGWPVDAIVDFVDRAGADGLVLVADHEVDAHRLGNTALEFRRAGVAVTVAPWPGTEPNLPDDRYDHILYDPRVSG